MKVTLRRAEHGLVPANDKGTKFFEGLAVGDELLANFPDEFAGTIPMLRTWRKWMQETATAMCHYGCTMPLFVDSKGVPHGTRPYSAEDAHIQFTSVYLGVDEQGRRKSWSMSESMEEVQASAGDRLWAMDQHLQWCAEKGIKLTIPVKSEYFKHKNQVGQA